jgi:ferredoxin
LFGRWASCHYLCWVAPFLVIGTRIKEWLPWPSLRLRADPENCAGCETCNAGFPMNLDVREMVRGGVMRNDECILCGNCADRCPSECIRYAFSIPAARTVIGAD